MVSFLRSEPRRWSWAMARGLAFLAFLVALLARTDSVVLDERAQTGDAAQNLEYGWTLGTTGRFAAESGELTMYREPLPVAGIALQVRFDPRLEEISLGALLSDGPASRAVKQQNLAWGALLLVGVALQVRRVTSRFRTPLVIVSVLAVHLVLVEAVAHRNLSELPAAALLVWAGLAGQAIAITGRGATIRRSLGQGILLGAVLGFAALTKASLLWIGLVHLLMLLVLIALRERRGIGRPALSLSVALVVMTMIVLPWMLRNATEFDTLAIADRGGISLWYRAIYEDATPMELRATWYAFSPPPARPVVGRLLGVSAEQFDGELSRVHRDALDGPDSPPSFYQLAREDRSELVAELVADGVPVQQARVRADQHLLARSLEVLRRDPGLFVTMTPMVLWRGMWPVPRAPLVPMPLLAVISALGMATLLATGARAVLRRDPHLFALVGLPFGLVLFSALLTLFWPRFSQPALPTMIVLLAMAVERSEGLVRRLRR